MPESGPGRLLTVASLVASVGFGLYAAGALIYFTRSVGLPLGTVGLGVSLAGVGGLLLSVPIGRLSDRWGARPTAIAFAAGQAVLLTAATRVGTVPAYLVVIFLLGIAEQGGNVARGALVAAIADPAGRVRLAAALRSAFNLGSTIGVLLAGVALAVDTRTAYLAILLGNAASAVLVAVLYAAVPVQRAQSPPAPRRGVVRDAPYMAVAGLAGLVTVSDTVLAVGVPLWTVTFTAAPRPLAAWLLAVNTALVVLLQVPASKGGDTIAGATRLARRATVVTALACLLLAVSDPLSRWAATGALLAGVVVLTFGELWSSTGAWGWRYGLAPEHAQGEWGGAFSLGTALRGVVGPVTVTALLSGLAGWGWVVLALLFLLTGLLVRPTVAWAECTRPARTAA
jgi:MFS family permease